MAEARDVVVSFSNQYSLADRLLHRIAFATPKLQIDFAEMEDARFAKAYGEVEASRPVFITALPRAGTTLLLNLCAGLEAFTSHTYRDMPFVLTPYMWREMSKGFRTQDTPRERAHGDGMLVSVDSPEALEEVLWKAFWKDQYADDRIHLWPETGGEAFRAFFRRHMAKLAKINQGDGARLPRYASKNNLNIARIAWLERAFPDAAIVVPFRAPVEHAASLLRQHRNFLALHRTDRFARDYMAGVGHYDFGAGLRPIDFDGWVDAAPSPPAELAFWLAYWCAAYGHCLRRHEGGVVWVDYDALCRSPAAALDGLARALGLGDGALSSGVGTIRPPRPHAPDLSGVDGALLETARVVHGDLRAAAARERREPRRARRATR